MGRERKIGTEVPLYLDFGPHVARGIPDQPRLFDRLKNVLNASPEKSAIYVTEKGYPIPDSTSARVSQLIDMGINAAIAYKLVVLQLISGNGSVNEDDINKAEAFQVGDYFTQSELNFVKNLHEEYPGRVQLYVESLDDESLKKHRVLVNQADDVHESLIGSIKGGDLVTAFNQLVEIVRLFADQMIIRENSVVSKIRNYLDTKSLLAAIGLRFGTAHTAIGHILKKEGYNVNMLYPSKTEIMDPFNIAVRKLRMNIPVKEHDYKNALQFLIDNQNKH
jgi:hypothetical protein